MADKLPFRGGASINRLPLFCGVNYQFWKVRMKIFMRSTNKEIWEAIENYPFIPQVKKDVLFVDKPSYEWTEADTKKAKLDWIAKNIMTSALSCDDFFRVSQCTSAKEMWDILEVTDEGTNNVKRARKHALIQEYELFRMQKGETISYAHKRFFHIVNHLMSLGKNSYKEGLNIKILKCLDRSWQRKVTTISKSKDLTSMITTSSFGKLREHELETNRLVVQESEDKHNKGISLKASNQKRQQDSSDSDEDTMRLLSRKFSKFLKKNKGQSSKRYSSKKLNEFNPNKYTCYGCGEQGQIKAECPNNESKEKDDFKGERRGKTKKAYIAWDDNEISSSSSSEDEEANLCLKASTSSSVSSSSSVKGHNYYQLLETFNERHEEANRLALLNNRLKGLNNWLENKVKALEEELQKSKVDFENLDLIFKNSACMCDFSFCENFESLEKKVHYLVKTIHKLKTGKSNFENVLASQNCVFRLRILSTEQKEWDFKTFFISTRKSTD
ncbi:uncharacterized protein [Phaseolus vulgaris]|uniref:uncharacterized protein n=1 Tax=Phaseolus vulgaris TaxID=3885 RepID=UPI0035CA600B